MTVTRKQLEVALRDHREYKAWRQRIPWTNEEVAAAFDRMAEQVEAGAPFLSARYRHRATWLRDNANTQKLTKHILRCAMPELIRRCAICQRTALYRRGVRGYCERHKSAIDHSEYFARLEASARADAVFERDLKERDRGKKFSHLLRWKSHR